MTPLLRVATVQLACKAGRAAENARRIRTAISRACDRGADVIVLPELAASGYALRDRAEALRSAEAVPDGDTVSAWCQMAVDRGVYICGGLAERDGDALYNTAVLVGPGGYVARYRKVHLYEDEWLSFRPGAPELTVVELEWGRVGLMVCYDAWHWELPMLLKLLGADVILNPTAWGHHVTPAWQVLPTTIAMHIGLAHVTRTYVASASMVGVERGRRYMGHSCIVGPDGLLTRPASDARPAIAYADIDPLRARHHRYERLSDQLADRRADLYDEWLGHRERRVL